MLNMELQKEQEINRMVTILQQIELTDIELLTRDANTLLMRKKAGGYGTGSKKGRIVCSAHIGNRIESEVRKMELTEEGLKQIEHHADRTKNVSIMFMVQILREVRELKALYKETKNSGNGSNNSTNSANESKN